MKRIGLALNLVFGLSLTVLNIVLFFAVFWYFAPHSPVARVAHWFITIGYDYEEENGQKLADCNGPMTPFILDPKMDWSNYRVSQMCTCLWDTISSDSRDILRRLQAGEIPMSESTTAFLIDSGYAYRACASSVGAANP